MRERDDVPEWALNQVRGHLRRGEEIINAVALKAGTKHVVLLNTSKGAALVVKGIIGDPDSIVLGFPRDLITYRCSACSARNVIIDITPPDDVHCSHCGHEQHLVRAGEVRAIGEAAAPATHKKPTPARRASKRKPTAATTPTKARPKAAERRPSKPRKATKATKATKAAPDNDYRPQCLAITPDNAQCRNSARTGSKYCGVHKGYQPPAAKKAGGAKDTVPRVKRAKDTAPSGRKRTTAKKKARVNAP